MFASEPMLVNPANMDIDAEGRVWVTEGVNYRLFKPWGKIQPDGDRIRILEDTDGDGKADVAKTFYQGNDVNAALGICVLGTKVIVSCSPKILVFTDENGDDKADGPPQVVFNGIGGRGSRPRRTRIRVRTGRQTVFQHRQRRTSPENAGR